MPLVYFDASAFVKLLTTETGSSLASALWDGCDAALSSRLAYPEVRAALAAAARNHDLTESELADAERDWEDFWAATRPVELTATVEQHAGHLARAHALRGRLANHAFGRETLQGVCAVQRSESCDRNPTFGDDDLATGPSSIEPIAEVRAQLGHGYIHTLNCTLTEP